MKNKMIIKVNGTKYHFNLQNNDPNYWFDTFKSLYYKLISNKNKIRNNDVYYKMQIFLERFYKYNKSFGQSRYSLPVKSSTNFTLGVKEGKITINPGDYVIIYSPYFKKGERSTFVKNLVDKNNFTLSKSELGEYHSVSKQIISNYKCKYIKFCMKNTL